MMLTLDDLRAGGITRVRVHYGDLMGTTRAKLLPLDELEEAVESGINFCVSVFSIDHTGVMPDGTGLRDEVQFRDMSVRPDLSTLRVVPWERDTALCLADCFFDGAPLPAEPRGILRRAIAEAEQRGLHVMCGHELEFFVFGRGANGELERYTSAPGVVYRMDQRVDSLGVIRQMEDAVRGLGLPFVCVNHEYDPSQWEINCRYDDVLKAADDAHLLKMVVKEIAAMNGLVATFMGRPANAGGTSGYHLHFSLWDEDGRNAMEDPDGELGLSDQARWFIGGQLEHARGLCAVMSPTVNAYRRYIAQELAPYWINWGPDNRSTYIRVPHERGKGTRIEARGADGTASPYLASAAALFAGIDGLDRKLDPGPPSYGVYEPGDYATMPFSLSEALEALADDRFLRERLSEQFVQCFTAIKRNEVQRFSLWVTDWELNEYLDAL